MHAAVRRMPVERARHAKRLAPVVVDSASDTLTGSTSAVASMSSQSTSSSAAQPSSSPTTITTTTTTSSTRPSSATSSTSSSTPTPSSTPLPTSTLPPSTALAPQQTTLTLINTPSSTSTPQPNAAATTSSGLSGGAIAGIIAGSIIVGVAIIVFLVRKTYLRRRERKRMSWNAMPGLGAGIPGEPKFPDISERLADDLNTPQASAPMSPFEAYGQSMYSTPVQPAVHVQPPTVSTYAAPALPPATYNNLTPVTTYPTQPVPSAYSVGNPTQFTTGRVAAGMSTVVPSVHAQHVPVEAMVKCTFVPTLPDELSITTGERIFILEQYDDGWVLGANGRGERGMVPRDCLEHAPSDQPGIGWRNVRTRSSLNPDGNRF